MSCRLTIQFGLLLIIHGHRDNRRFLRTFSGKVNRGRLLPLPLNTTPLHLLVRISNITRVALFNEWLLPKLFGLVGFLPPNATMRHCAMAKLRH